jgi:hypothetical protein
MLQSFTLPKKKKKKKKKEVFTLIPQQIWATWIDNRIDVTLKTNRDFHQ